MKFNLSDTASLIRSRRSIPPEKLSSRKVHREQIEAMIEAANWAPTHGLTEPWRFKIYSGNAFRKLMDVCAGIYRKYTPEEKFQEDKFNRFASRAERLSHVIVVTMKRQESGIIPEWEENMAVACAIQNFSLMATAYGMGCFWSTGKNVTAPEMREFLHLDAKDTCVGILYIGYPENGWPEGKRHTYLNKMEWFNE
jgi:nitroreductase